MATKHEIVSRSLVRTVQLPPPAAGQFGPDHTVVEVLKAEGRSEQDPHTLLMDARIGVDLRAGQHPRAGFETVIFPLEGRTESEAGLARSSSEIQRRCDASRASKSACTAVRRARSRRRPGTVCR